MVVSDRICWSLEWGVTQKEGALSSVVLAKIIGTFSLTSWCSNEYIHKSNGSNQHKSREEGKGEIPKHRCPNWLHPIDIEKALLFHRLKNHPRATQESSILSANISSSLFSLQATYSLISLSGPNFWQAFIDLYLEMPEVCRSMLMRIMLQAWFSFCNFHRSLCSFINCR